MAVRPPTPIKAVALVSNGISAAMALQAAARDGYAPSDIALIKQRKFDLVDQDRFAHVIEFNRKASLTMLGQANALGYFLRATAGLRRWLRSGTVRDIYVANVDNLHSNHLLQQTRLGRLKGSPRLSVVAEGFMNYQDIGMANRPAWRWAVKPAAARLLGLRYVQPVRHLSGAFEPEVSRVFTYSADGIKAPVEKVIEIPFPSVAARVRPELGTALLVLTGIGQWMAPHRFAEFKMAFQAWMSSQNFKHVWVKRHPNYPSGGMEDYISEPDYLSDNLRLEDMAADIPAETVIGYCSTGLVTLKLMRPDLRIIDWGSDFYCEHAYHGDRSIVAILNSARIGITNMSDGAQLSE